jgi:hypothetical protein
VLDCRLVRRIAVCVVCLLVKTVVGSVPVLTVARW